MVQNKTSSNTSRNQAGAKDNVLHDPYMAGHAGHEARAVRATSVQETCRL